MNYGNLIIGAFRITWRFKFLWLYGIFLGTGLNFNSFNYNLSLDDSDARLFRGHESVKEITRWINDNLTLIIALVAVIIFLALLFWVVRIISQSAVVWSVAKAKNETAPTFLEAFKVGLTFFWRLFGLFLLVSLVLVLFLLIFLVPPFFIFFSTFGNGPIIAFPILALFILLIILVVIPLIVFVNVLVMYAIRFIVIDDRHIMNALGSSVRLIRNNPGTSLLVWLLSAALVIAIAIALFVAIILLGIPIGLLAYFLITSGVTVVKIAILATLGIALTMVILTLSGFGQAYFSAFWTLAWIELTQPEKLNED